MEVMLGLIALVVLGTICGPVPFRMFLHSWRLGLQWMEKTHLIEDPITWQEDLLQGEKVVAAWSCHAAKSESTCALLLYDLQKIL